jgi:HrpA-like RNA helicase
MMRQLFSEIFPEVLIIDEVQNKSIATDLLLFLSKYKIDIQLIIMSATLDPKLYQTYLETR